MKDEIIKMLKEALIVAMKSLATYGSHPIIEKKPRMRLNFRNYKTRYGKNQDTW